MITNDEMTDAFTEVLIAAGAEQCDSCGRQALVRTAGDTTAELTAGHEPDAAADRETWFCFACGHQRN